MEYLWRVKRDYSVAPKKVAIIDKTPKTYRIDTGDIYERVYKYPSKFYGLVGYSGLALFFQDELSANEAVSKKEPFSARDIRKLETTVPNWFRSIPFWKFLSENGLMLNVFESEDAWKVQLLHAGGVEMSLREGEVAYIIDAKGTTPLLAIDNLLHQISGKVLSRTDYILNEESGEFERTPILVQVPHRVKLL